MYMHYNHCHRERDHLQLNIIIIIHDPVIIFYFELLCHVKKNKINPEQHLLFKMPDL